MWRFMAAATAASVVTIVAVSMHAPTTYACSVGPNFNPVREADIVVEGRFDQWDVVVGGAESFFTIDVPLSVVRVHHGEIDAGEVIVRESSSLYGLGRGVVQEWRGSGGSCGLFDDEPTGKLAIIGLAEGPEGTYASSLPLLLYLGEEASGPDYERALERLDMFKETAQLPALGAGPGASGDAPTVPIALAVVGAALALTGGATALMLRRRAA